MARGKSRRTVSIQAGRRRRRPRGFKFRASTSCGPQASEPTKKIRDARLTFPISIKMKSSLGLHRKACDREPSSRMRSPALTRPVVTARCNAIGSLDNHSDIKAPIILRRKLLGDAALLGACGILLQPSQQAKAYDAASIFNITATLDGQDFPFSQFEGKVLCIVNVASE